MKKRTPIGSLILTCFFAALSIVWLLPIVAVLVNSFKTNAGINLDAFALPAAETFAGFANYIKGFTFGNYPFLLSIAYSTLITVVSVFLILLCCSMTAWYIARVGSKFSKICPKYFVFENILKNIY